MPSGLALPLLLQQTTSAFLPSETAGLNTKRSLFLFRGQAWLCALGKTAGSGRAEVAFLNGGGLESSFWRSKCGEMGSGEVKHLQSPVPGFHSDPFFCTIMTFLWHIGDLPHKHLSIDASGGDQIIMINNNPQLAIRSMFSDCQAPGWPMAGLWFRSSIQQRGRECLVVPGQPSSISSYLPPPCLQPGQTHPESDRSSSL